MNNTTIKSAIILIENLLNNPQKFSRQALSNRLKEEEFPHSPSAITRLLKFIDSEFGVSIKVNRSKFVYEIDKTATLSNFEEQYNLYKSLHFRNLLHQNSATKEVTGQYLSFGFATKNKNIEFTNPLLNAILENRKVKLEYLPFYEENATFYTVKPLFIKEYLNRWYLITEKLDQRHNVFAIDRIQDYEILKSTFKRSHEITPQTFKNTIGVNFSGSVEAIKLWVSKKQYPYFETLPFHISQKTEKEVKDGFIISFEVTLNFELQQWLLFFGDSIKILAPQTLKNDIIDNLKRNLEQYGQ